MVNAVKVVRKGKVGVAKVGAGVTQEEVAHMDTIVKQAVAEASKAIKADSRKKAPAKAQGLAVKDATTKIAAKAAAPAKATEDASEAGEVAGVYFKFSQNDVRKAFKALAKNADSGTIEAVAVLASQFGAKTTVRLVKALHEGKEPNFASLAKGRE